MLPTQVTSPKARFCECRSGLQLGTSRSSGRSAHLCPSGRLSATGMDQRVRRLGLEAQALVIRPGESSALSESIATGEVHGHVYSTGLRRNVGKSFESPVPVHSIDEMVIILRRDSGLHFDAELPGYHLYGTDICLQSWQRGLPCFVIDNFCLHNSNGIRRLPLAFWRSYRIPSVQMV